MTEMSPAPSAAPRQQRRGGTGLIVTGVVLLVLSLVVGVFAVVKAATPLVSNVSEALTAPELTTPVDQTLDLKAGEYNVYELVGASATSTDARSSEVTLTPDEVTVTAPDGSELAVRSTSTTETFSRGESSYRAAVRFTTTQSGAYRVVITGASGRDLVVAPSIVSGVRSSAGWGALAGVCGLVFLLGGVLLVVGLVLRFRRPKALAPQPVLTPQPVQTAQSPAGATPPAGWYADPSGAAPLRYWDGTSWTAHTN